MTASSWEVEYVLRSPIPAERQIIGYPLLGLSLDFDDQCRIGRIRHAIISSAEADPTAVVHESERSLSLFLQILEFMYGLPIEMKSVRVNAAAPGQKTGASRTALASSRLGAAIACTVRLPAEQALTGLNPRLEGLLYMFNAARSATDSEAVRLHHMIWESGELPCSKGVEPIEAQHLRIVRDFVSHGVRLDRNLRAIAYIESKLGRTIEPYNPADTGHLKFVARERAVSSRFIESRLAGLFPSTPAT